MGPGKPLEQQEFPIPKILEPGALLVKTGMATVCGSDVHTWKGRRPFPTPSMKNQPLKRAAASRASGVNPCPTPAKNSGESSDNSLNHS